MGYKKIPNLYRDIRILDFKECYALEKIHGTSAHIKFAQDENKNIKLTFFSGGCKYEEFYQLFNKDGLLGHFLALGFPSVTVYGEAYGGKLQGMSKTYGNDLKFVAFEVQIGEAWCNVPDAYEIVTKLGLDFVDFAKGEATLEWITNQTLRPSVQAIKNGIGVKVVDNIAFIEEEKMREGVVLRPIQEYFDYRGNRIITKHKNEAFQETRTKREVNPSQLQVLADAEAVAKEWVTPMRLQHVLDKLPEKGELSHIPNVIKAMTTDILEEGVDEIIWSKEVERAIAKQTAILYKKSILLLKNLKEGL